MLIFLILRLNIWSISYIFLCGKLSKQEWSSGTRNWSWVFSENMVSLDERMIASHRRYRLFSFAFAVKRI